MSKIELNSSRDRRKIVRRRPSMEWYLRPYSAIIQRCRDFSILQFEKFCYGNTIISLQPFPWQWRGGNKRTREWSLVFDFLLMKKHYLAINRSFTFNRWIGRAVSLLYWFLLNWNGKRIPYWIIFYVLLIGVYAVIL